MAEFLNSLPDTLSLIWNTLTNKWLALISILWSLAAEHTTSYLLLKKAKSIDSVENFNNLKIHIRKNLAFKYYIFTPGLVVIFLELGRISEVLALWAVTYAIDISYMTIGTIINLKRAKE